jgi:hypothetical protein
LSNGFSRKIENHMAAVAINYFTYKFIKIHRTLRMSPALAVGVTTRLFEVSDLVNLLIESESQKAAQERSRVGWRDNVLGSDAEGGLSCSDIWSSYRCPRRPQSS